ncbi:hypothetical protein HID58_041250 [Brassica napus]|uniref:Ethylene-responsive nuclear protein n=2 Tax=Brassica TaxID=3705 RepID=A0A3P6FMY7_BRAOL|nr:uncharacterized protein LOC106375685 [Brassica napus]KAH0901747.1 hypothetical protein HID58_041250 [Brassica napus]CAF2070154.1 unnamed protein product [Brassica napus]VDD49034.1 unnamed protein product [Brassica oleracea]
MPLPWKKSKSGRISKFVSDLQQSPKRGGSLVVETGFPTSLIHLFFKNRDRLKKSSSKRNNNNKAQIPTGPSHSHSTRQRVASLPPPISSLPASVTEDPAASKIDESFVCDGGSTPENRNDGNGGDHDGGGGGGCCVLMVVAIKVFVVAVLALSTKKLAVGITFSAFALLFLEFAVPRVLTLLNLCPNAQVRLDSLIRKLIGTKKLESSPPSSSSPSSSTQERTRNNVSFEIIETLQEQRDRIEETRVPEPPPENQPAAEEREVLTIRDVVFTKEKSKSAKLKSKIVKKIVPKKLRSYKKKKKLKKMKEKEEAEGVEIEIFEEGGEGSTTEASSLYSEDITESEVSERYEIGSNPPLLESCEEEEEEDESKRDLTKVMVMIVIALAGLLGGKVLAIVLTVSSCLFLRLVCSKSQTIL